MNNHVELRVTIPREMYERLLKACTQQGQKKPALVRVALDRYLRDTERVYFPSDKPL